MTFYHPQRCTWQNTSVTCPLYVVCYTNVDIPIAIKGNALAYEFNLSNDVVTKMSFTTSEDSLRRPYGYKGGIYSPVNAS